MGILKSLLPGFGWFAWATVSCLAAVVTDPAATPRELYGAARLDSALAKSDQDAIGIAHSRWHARLIAIRQHGACFS